MPIALRSSTSVATTGPGTTVTVPKPAGLANGDLLTIHLGRFTEAANSVTITWAAPAGFTDVPLMSPVVLRALDGRMFYKVITDAANEPADYTFTLTPSAGATLHVVGGAAAWTGVSTTHPIDAGLVGQEQTPTSTSAIAPGLTTITDAAMLVFFTINRQTATHTPPPGMTEVLDLASTGGTATSRVSAELAYELLGAKGATGTRTGTLSGAQRNIGTLLALRSASAIESLPARFRLGGAWKSATIRRIA